MADGGDATTKKTLLILGKAGNGKSSTANSILAGLNFQVYHSFNSNDLQCQAQENESIRVVCAPDLHQRMFIDRQSNKGAEVEIDEEKEVRSWITDHCKGEPDAVILVIRCDQRFTPEEFNAFKRLKANRYLEEGMKKLVIVFTAGDRLNGRDMRQEVESNDPYLVPVYDIWNDAQKRYVVFDNTAKGPRNNIQVKALMDVVERMAPHPFPQHICRLLLVGSKATIGAVQENLKILTNGAVGIFGHFDLKDLNDLHLEVTCFCPDKPETTPLDKVKVAVSPGPHAILTLQEGNIDIKALFGQSARPEFIHRVGINDFKSRDALVPLLTTPTFPARTLSGEFFRTAELGKTAERICEETIRRTVKPGESAVSSYVTYLLVKKEIIG